ncbi:hypothetical protein RLIN73S_00621 [Rhodanobacter lindaniclasticus]
MSARAHGLDLQARSRARRRALQALYAWQLSGSHMNAVIEQFRHEQDMEVADLEYFEDLLHGVEQHVDESTPACARIWTAKSHRSIRSNAPHCGWPPTS